MYKIVIVNGPPESGKTTFEKLCDIKVTSYIFSTISPIKEVAKKLGWYGLKTPKDRWFLGELKKISKQYNNFPVDWVVERIHRTIDDYNSIGIDIENSKFKKAIFFVDCREVEEIEELKEKLNAVTLFISRPNKEVFSDAASDDVKFEVFPYDYHIINDSSFTDFRNTVEDFVEELFKGENSNG